MPLGATLMVEDGQNVAKDGILFTWDPYTNPIMTDVAGLVRVVDIVAGLTIPVLMMFLLTNVFATERGWRPFVVAVPLCIVDSAETLATAALKSAKIKGNAAVCADISNHAETHEIASKNDESERVRDGIR